MDLVHLFLVAAYGTALAFLFCKFLGPKLSRLAYLGAGLFGYLLGAGLLSEIVGTDPLVLKIDSARVSLLWGAAGVLGVVAIAKFARID